MVAEETSSVGDAAPACGIPVRASTISGMDNIITTFIGGGNMGRALMGGLIAGGTQAESIHVADPSEAQRKSLVDDLGVTVHDDNAEAARTADVLVVAVKPQVIDQVLASLAGAIDDHTLVISVAAGIPLQRLSNDLGGHRRLVRAMPNTPALYQAGISGLCAADGVDSTDRRHAEQIMAAAGEVIWVADESLMDVVTAVSGSGPAYFFALTEALAAAGEQAGLDPQTAGQLARQTACGSGVMLARSPHPAGELRRRVTSPGGTTAAALEQLESAGFAKLVKAAVAAAVRRGRELGSN